MSGSMKKTGNRERILAASTELFNQSGVVAITTNHIADHLGISPGNLYFHFRNKESIIAELFDEMSKSLYAVWLGDHRLESEPARGKKKAKLSFATPTEMIEETFKVFFRYRFFHREMYHLRRKDPHLARKWKTHLAKSVRLLKAYYAHWVRDNVMIKVEDEQEMQMISDVVLITSSSFLQFFESPEKPAHPRVLRQGISHILRLLLPYHSDAHKAQVRGRIQSMKH